MVHFGIGPQWIYIYSLETNLYIRKVLTYRNIRSFKKAKKLVSTYWLQALCITLGGDTVLLEERNIARQV